MKSATAAELSRSPAMNEPTKYQRFRHYKGNLYEVITEAKHSETNQTLVIYRSLDEPGKIWARPKDMFYGTVEINCQIIPRFEALDKEA